MAHDEVGSPLGDSEHAARPDPALYPDVAMFGSLQNALQAELDRIQEAVVVLAERPPGWRYVGARVENDRRDTSVLMGIQERVFLMQFWDRGVCMARGSTDDLRAVAGAARTWQAGVRVRELGSAWPFVSFGGFAEAVERGEANEYKWQRYYENPRRAPQLIPLQPFIAIAIGEPRLRALLPFTSHQTLGFSRTVGYPYNGDCPWVTPVDGERFVVKSADGRVLGTADAVGSVALVLAALDEGDPS